jgi:ubiquinone/menaquinone biosynthesis C-methylase UbiE
MEPSSSGREAPPRGVSRLWRTRLGTLHTARLLRTASGEWHRPTIAAVADRHFEHPRLAAIYDAVNGDRSDLRLYEDIVRELGGRRVLDVGCGTGTFALRLADRGLEVTGVDPAQASLDVARRKPRADGVRWLVGDATCLPPMQVDVVTMTANVAQAIVQASEWQGTLRGIYAALRPEGHLVFETRDPARRVWQNWNPQASRATTSIPGAGTVEHWVDLTDVAGPLVTFRSTFVFSVDGAVLTSDSTLRFRTQDEIEADLVAHGFILENVRRALEGPEEELVFLARTRRDVIASRR